MSQDDSSPLTRDIAPFGVRMPPDLKDRVAAAAKANNRSMNAEIVHRLEASLDPTMGTVGLLLSAQEKVAAQKNEQTLYVIIDANGLPQSWDETFEHLRAIRKAGGFNPAIVNAVVYNGPRVSSSTREDHADEIARWYKNYLRNHPYSRAVPTPTDD